MVRADVKKHTQQRNHELDALRGLSILGMVFASSIAFSILPAWMYHAQEPPPTHAFNPSIAGISWVDLVFPLFLFSMGAAIPLALDKLNNLPLSLANRKIFIIALRRFGLLFFFGLIAYYTPLSGKSGHWGIWEQLLPVIIFIILHLFLKNQIKQDSKRSYIVKIVSFILLAFFLFISPILRGEKFSLYNCDIIILILANVVFWATLLWWITRTSKMIRAAIVILIFAFFSGANINGSWNHAFVSYSPLPWLFNFLYLKYLLIVIPATYVGEWIKKSEDSYDTMLSDQNRLYVFLSGGGVLILLVLNVTLLFSRKVLTDVYITAVLLLLMWICVKRVKNKFPCKLVYMFQFGSFLLLAGLFMEPCEGGIKKDPVTFSYLFVSAGLAIFVLIFLYMIAVVFGIKSIAYIALAGRNPMVAYVCGAMLLSPFLKITRLYYFFDQMSGSIFLGILRGVLYTGIVMIITIVFTKRKWFWKT